MDEIRITSQRRDMLITRLDEMSSTIRQLRRRIVDFDRADEPLLISGDSMTHENLSILGGNLEEVQRLIYEGTNRNGPLS